MPSKESLGFRSPMLATTATSLPKGNWVAEEKYDGHRLIVSVRSGGQFTAWSRQGNERAPEKLSAELKLALSRLPRGVYDGELVVPGGNSSAVTDSLNRSKLRYVIFDLLEQEGFDRTNQPLFQRREALEQIWINYINDGSGLGTGPLELAHQLPIRTWAEAEELAGRIWEEKGEGLILKDLNAPYCVGKRTKTFLKIKECQPAVLKIIGFAPTEGEVNNYGDFGTAVLQDAEGVIIPVKVLDDETRARLAKVDHHFGQRTWREVRLSSTNRKVQMHVDHPWVGRKLHIEFQTRTPDGSYRHPRWDRLEGE